MDPRLFAQFFLLLLLGNFFSRVQSGLFESCEFRSFGMEGVEFGLSGGVN